MDDLIAVDVMFQALLESLPGDDWEIAAALDTDSFEKVPFVTHHVVSLIQNGNGRGLWSCVLNISAFIVAGTDGDADLRALYAGIHSWALPDNGIVPSVGAVETVDDIDAFTRNGQGVPMLNKIVTHYVGSFQLTIRNH